MAIYLGSKSVNINLGSEAVNIIIGSGFKKIKTIDVYVTVERTLLGNQDPILAPTKVTVPEGSTVMDVLDQLKKEVAGFDFTSTGSVADDTAYVKGFKVPSHGAFNYKTDYEFLSDYIAELGEENIDMYFDYSQTPSVTDLYLEVGDYNILGDWIVTANNKIKWGNKTDGTPAASFTHSTIENNNTVLRFEYSLAMGRDCGYQGWSLSTLTDMELGFYVAVDKSELVKQMANCADKTSAAYVNGMGILKKMKATNAEVKKAVALF